MTTTTSQGGMDMVAIGGGRASHGQAQSVRVTETRAARRLSADDPAVRDLTSPGGPLPLDALVRVRSGASTLSGEVRAARLGARDLLRSLALRQPAAVRAAGLGRTVAGREAVGILARADARRAARAVAEAARRAAAPTLEQRLATIAARYRPLEEALAAHLARAVGGCGGLVRSQYATVCVGRASEERDRDRYSRGWHRAHGGALTRHAGVRVDRPSSRGGQWAVVVEASSGGRVAVLPLRAGTWRRDPGAMAQELVPLRSATTRAMDRVGPAADDDRVMLTHPRLVCARADGAACLISDGVVGFGPWGRTPTCQVVVRDVATGRRHAITVPPRYAAPLAAGERAEDRIRAAVAWTFGRRPEEYRPAVEA